jgi:hypothetical protein
VYSPADLVVVEIDCPVPEFVRVTLTPGITEPLVSRTVPDIEPVSTWQRAIAGRIRTNEKRVQRRATLQLIGLCDMELS